MNEQTEKLILYIINILLWVILVGMENQTGVVICGIFFLYLIYYPISYNK